MDSAVLCVVMPFESQRRNALAVSSSCLGVVQCLVLLALVQQQLGVGSAGLNLGTFPAESGEQRGAGR